MPRRTNRAFTLAEVLVASTISAFVALTAAGALKAIGDSAERIDRVSKVGSEVRFATRMLARDLGNLYRDQDPRNMRLVGASQGTDGSDVAYLRFYAVGRAGARDNQPEGDVYEIEYVLGPDMNSDDGADDEATRSILFRRLWPNPHRDRPPGGVVTSIAENIDVFQIRFHDGQDWTDQWPEEMQTLPELVEVTLMTLSSESEAPTVGRFMMNFPRLPGGMAPPSGRSEPGQTPDRQGPQPPSSEPSDGPPNNGSPARR